MSAPVPADPDFDRRVRASFARQKVMGLLGASIERVAPGEVDIRVPFREELGQQHGFFHAGVMTTVADSACGYSALSLMPPGAAVLTTEFKVNLLAPGAGEEVVARARVVKAGRTLTVSMAEVFARSAGKEKLVALMVATNMTLAGRAGMAD
jgi:uncharacterized protein (TIGR00369 family)